MCHGKSVLRRLHEDPDETEFCDRTSCQLRHSLQCQLANPTRDSSMEFMLQESQRYQSIHVEKIRHGNSDKISRTCLLLSRGASEPALSTGRPVTGSTTMITFRERALLGVSTMRPPSTPVSRGSPVRRRSFRRICTGSTISHFVESLVSMVRQSYLIPVLVTTLGPGG